MANTQKKSEGSPSTLFSEDASKPVSRVLSFKTAIYLDAPLPVRSSHLLGNSRASLVSSTVLLRIEFTATDASTPMRALLPHVSTLTSSAQTSYPSLRRKRQSSYIPLRLLCRQSGALSVGGTGERFSFFLLCRQSGALLAFLAQTGDIACSLLTGIKGRGGIFLLHFSSDRSGRALPVILALWSPDFPHARPFGAAPATVRPGRANIVTDGGGFVKPDCIFFFQRL